MTILVIDDEDDVRKLIAGALRRGGHVVVEAAGCAAALDICDEVESVEVVVSDYNMPDGNGLILAKELRRRHPYISIILMSANVTVHDDVASEGFVCLQKPFEMADLDAAIAAICRS
jgi:DNA-binding NtrC family response regulator